MPTEEKHSRIDVKNDGVRVGVERGEPGGRAARDADAPRRAPGSVAVDELPPESSRTSSASPPADDALGRSTRSTRTPRPPAMVGDRMDTDVVSGLEAPLRERSSSSPA